jgi:parallel beta-helix repeat protein
VLQKGPVGDYMVVINGETTHYPGIFNIFDTGTGDTTFYVAQRPNGALSTDDGKFPLGSEVRATFVNALPSGEALTWSFTVGSTPSVDRAFYTVEDASKYPKSLPNVVPGLNLYNDFDVLFDAQKQLIYLRPNGGLSTVYLESVTTTGAQSYQQGNVTLDGNYTTGGGAFSVAGTTTLNGDTTTVNAGAGEVRFSGTVDGAEAGAHALVVNTSGATTFVREVGFSNALSALSVTGGGSTATAAVTTNGSQSYGGDVSLNGPYWVNDTGSAFTVAGATTLVGPVTVNTCGATGEPSCVGHGANIIFNGPVDSFTGKGFPLTVVAGDNGVVTFNEAVGAHDPLGGLAITNADTVTARGVVSLNGGLGYSAAVGLHMGSTGDGDRVRAANFIAGGSVLGFQLNGGPNFGATNGSGVGCSNDSTPGACGSGVVVEGGSQLAIQGFTIANNASDGVHIVNSSDVTITGNNILGNASDGVAVTGASAGNTFTNNTISGNSDYGVSVSGSGAVGNAILSNSIYLNTDGGILLSNGGNDGQPAPESVTAQLQGSSILVSGNVIARDGYSGMFQLQVFGNQDNVRQGKQFLGSSVVSAGALTPFTVPVGTWASGTTDYITVTATPVDGLPNTSGFSIAAAVTQ